VRAGLKNSVIFGDRIDAADRPKRRKSPMSFTADRATVARQNALIRRGAYPGAEKIQHSA
jgi:hypothetical protein